MLQGLELADEFAELLALAQIRHRAIEGLLARADQLRCERGAADIQRALQRIPPCVKLAEDRVGADADVVEAQARGIVRIDHRACARP